MQDIWLDMYEKELDARELASHLDWLSAEVAFFREAFFEENALIEPNPDRVWEIFYKLWAVEETRHLGNPQKILEYGNKYQLAKQMWYMIKAALENLNPDSVLVSGPFGNVGVSMRTEILFKLFPGKYPIKNWKSECGLMIVVPDTDFVTGSYSSFIEYVDRVLGKLHTIPKIIRFYSGDNKYIIADHFLGNYVFWHEDNRRMIEMFKEQYDRDLSLQKYRRKY